MSLSIDAIGYSGYFRKNAKLRLAGKKASLHLYRREIRKSVVDMELLIFYGKEMSRSSALVGDIHTFPMGGQAR